MQVEALVPQPANGYHTTRFAGINFTDTCEARVSVVVVVNSVIQFPVLRGISSTENGWPGVT